MINLSTVTNALKNFYITPLREDINLKADPFASRILHTSDNITGYNEIVRAAQIGANGGAGAGTETGDLPTSGENIYIQLKSTTKNLYGTLSISDKSMKSVTGNNAGAFVNALQQDMDTLRKTLQWNTARQIYGDGSGKLCTLSAQTSAGKEIKVSDSTQFLLPGLKVDLHAAGGAVTTAGLRLTDVDHVKKTIRVDQNVTCEANAYLTIQGSAGLELTGLGKIFETISGTSQMLYGLNRSEYSWLRPYLNASFGAIDEVKLQNVINILEDTYNITINHINCGNSAYDHYMNLMNKRRAINDVMILEGGHKALKFNGMPLTRNKFMPDAGIDLYDTSLFTVDQIADWEWIEGETRQILHQVPGKPVYTASLTKYCDMMCVLPGGIARLTGVSAAT
jgi:hypothetical protein